MNEKEIGEIRRRIRRDRSNMTSIYGCYVNGEKEIISEFRQGVGLMAENDAEKYFSVMKRTLSGTVGKNLIDITFRTAQVQDSPEHKLLMSLRETGLQDEEVRMALFRKIIDTFSYEDSYVILIGCDRYDVPYKSKDDEIQADASDEIYKYLLCCVCPVKMTKANLRYIAENKEFHDGGIQQIISAPEIGFLFPAFDNRSTNIYNALYYTHSPKNNHEEVIEALFHVEAPKPAEEQKKTFDALLSNSLDEDCSLEVVQAVHDQLCQSIELHKESKIAEPLMVSKEEVKNTLQSCGIPEDKIAKFSVDYDEAFGFEAQLHPKNIIDNRSFEVKTPDVSIKVSPERSDLLETRVIGGVKYILICADDSVEVNGVPISIEGEEEPSTV